MMYIFPKMKCIKSHSSFTSYGYVSCIRRYISQLITKYKVDNKSCHKLNHYRASDKVGVSKPWPWELAACFCE